jgi:L-serine dehydratase
VEFHPSGSLATTHESQGSDMGLFGGLLGWEATDPRLPESAGALEAAGIDREIRISDYPAPHPNTYRLTLRRAGRIRTVVAISTGGGMVEVLEVDGASVSLRGDRFETLLWSSEGVEMEAVAAVLEAPDLQSAILEMEAHGGEPEQLVRVSSLAPLPEEVQRRLESLPGVSELRTLVPVLPVLSPPDVRVPFLSADEVLSAGAGEGVDLGTLALRYESARGGIPEEEVHARMEEIVAILEGSITDGLAGTEYRDRILGPQVGKFLEARKAGRLLDAGVLDTVVSYVTALMEVKSAMGVIVAAPTAGACGALPGACLGVGHALGLNRGDLTRAMLAAGLVGVLIAHRSTFAAEVCGCQAECGAGSGMAAAALVTLAGGGTEVALGAASMALQNTLGMICDPVANRVEVPCLGRNVLAAANALACANMALAGFDPVVPLDEVIETMDSVGRSLPHTLRCTALGGLSVTPTSKRIEESLQ